jgi:hypothetical protein
MRCSRSFLLCSLAAVLCLHAPAADKKDKKGKDDAQSASSGKKKKGDKTATPTPTPATPVPSADGQPPTTPPAEEAKPVSKLSLPLPKGQDSKGVVIPYTDGTGKKTMVFRIGIGTRLDDDNVKMVDLKIETFDDEGKPEMSIDLPHSKMNLATRIIAGEDSVTIKRSDFQITGKTMEFNTETKQGWIKGDVKMIIYDLTDETGDTTPKKGGQGS